MPANAHGHTGHTKGTRIHGAEKRTRKHKGQMGRMDKETNETHGALEHAGKNLCKKEDFRP